MDFWNLRLFDKTNFQQMLDSLQHAKNSKRQDNFYVIETALGLS